MAREVIYENEIGNFMKDLEKGKQKTFYVKCGEGETFRAEKFTAKRW